MKGEGRGSVDHTWVLLICCLLFSFIPQYSLALDVWRFRNVAQRQCDSASYIFGGFLPVFWVDRRERKGGRAVAVLDWNSSSSLMRESMVAT